MNTNPLNQRTHLVRTLAGDLNSEGQQPIGIYQVKLHITDHRVGCVLLAAESEEHARQLALQQPRISSWIDHSSTEVGEVLHLRNLAC